MRIAVCIEKSGGLLFNNRRLSKDIIVIKKLLELIGNGKIYLNDYSAKLFDSTERLKISNNFLSECSETDICFVENTKIPIDDVTEIYLFQWNRHYPADVYFEFNLKEMNFKKVSTENFVGNSHKKITLEIYRRT